jgi:inner membrane protein
MDSLTQIILGAACGEAVLGKKIGNRALLFGAIGGTIPDRMFCFWMDHLQTV